MTNLAIVFGLEQLEEDLCFHSRVCRRGLQTLREAAVACGSLVA